ncbi:MAG: glycosyltransferase family 2 protein [Clostridiales bacterium]|nr:glycosyltransferase family 2 protein [Candidatus Scatonaster coprocaballi]
MDNLYVVMPAYNEEANIEEVVKAWYPVLEGKGEGSRLVVADSGSVDKTHEILLSLKEKYPKVEVLPDTLKQHGPKLIALYKYAIAQGADYIFQTDSDGQTSPAEFAAFWELRNQHDAILGNRVVRGDGKSRKFVEKFLCFLLRLYFGVKVKDSNAPFRLMKASLVNKYVGRFKEDYNLPNVMLTTFFAYYNENYTLKEITFKPRQGGKNSINIKKIIKIGWAALGDFRAFKKEMKKSKK